TAHAACCISVVRAPRGSLAHARVQHRAGHFRHPPHRVDLRDHHDTRCCPVTILAGERSSDDLDVVDATGAEDESRRRPPSARLRIAIVAGLFILMYAVAALLRRRSPYELEWIEGGMVNHVARLRGGQPLYGAPSLTFTPDIYTPLYFVVAAVM